MKHLSLSIILILFASIIDAQNQTPILERKVTIKILNQNLGKALNILSETAKFNFSYNTQIVKVNRIVSIHAENRTVREILDQLLGTEMSYQQIGNHLVIQKKISPRSTSSINTGSKTSSRYDMIISGYIRDINSGDGITQVSIYHKPSLANTLSGDFGYYKLSLSSKTPEFELQIRKDQYRDTTIKITCAAGGVIEQHINLQSTIPPLETEETLIVPVMLGTDSSILPLSDTTLVKTQDSSKVPSNKIFVRTLDSVLRTPRLVWLDTSLKNIKVEDTRIAQWLIGTYQRVINNNIRDSFKRDWQVTFVPPLGTNGALSGLVDNALSFNVLIGYNGGLHGAEMGGLFNIIRQDIEGVQIAGLGNVVGRNTTGVQVAGLFNHNLGDARAVQVAGFYNYNRGVLDGVQVAGFANVSRQYSRTIQTAGFINIAEEIDGGQIAGFVNVAKKIRGFQIGIVNIADSSEGLAIGIVNFIRNGIHQLEFGYSDLSQYSLAYRSGSGRFYSAISFNSTLPVSDTSLMCYGFAIGNRARLGKHFYWNTDLGTQHMTYNLRSNHLNLHNKLSTGLEIEFFKGFSIFGAVSLNHTINDSTDPLYDQHFSKLGNDIIWRNEARYAQKAWLGYQFGVRLF